MQLRQRDKNSNSAQISLELDSWDLTFSLNCGFYISNSKFVAWTPSSGQECNYVKATKKFKFRRRSFHLWSAHLSRSSENRPLDPRLAGSGNRTANGVATWRWNPELCPRIRFQSGWSDSAALWWTSATLRCAGRSGSSRRRLGCPVPRRRWGWVGAPTAPPDGAGRWATPGATQAAGTAIPATKRDHRIRRQWPLPLRFVHPASTSGAARHPTDQDAFQFSGYYIVAEFKVWNSYQHFRQRLELTHQNKFISSVTVSFEIEKFLSKFLKEF